MNAYKLFNVAFYFIAVFFSLIINLRSEQEIPKILKEKDVYTYVLEHAENSVSFDSFKRPVGKDLVELINSKDFAGKRFCNFYYKFSVLPDLYVECIVYTVDKSDQIAVLAHKVTEFGTSCILIQLQSLAEFTEKNFTQFIQYFEKIPENHSFKEIHKFYVNSFRDLILEDSRDSLQGIIDAGDSSNSFEYKLHLQRWVAEFIIKSRRKSDNFYLNSKINDLGCYQLSEKYFCSVLLISSDVIGYCLVTTLFVKDEDKIILVGIYFDSSVMSIINKSPFNLSGN